MKKKKKTLLWEISVANPNTLPSYIFGTMHVRDQRVFQKIELLKEKIDRCSAFATEFDLAEASQETSIDAIHLPDDLTLDQLLKPKIYQKLEELLLEETGYPLSLFNNNLPVLLANIFAENILSKDMPVSLDETLWQYAKAQEKKVLGIESYKEQLAILHRIPLKNQVKMLRGIVKDYSAYRKETLKMTYLYEQSEIRKLYKASKRNLRGMRKLLLYDRNKIMANRIAQMTKEHNIFCAIGAAHLAGGKGVLRFLKKEGFAVHPVQY